MTKKHWIYFKILQKNFLNHSLRPGSKGNGVQKNDRKAFSGSGMHFEYSENGILYISHWTNHDVYNISDYSLVQRSVWGEIYEQGLVVQQDYKEAARWYRRAARKFFLLDYCTPRYTYNRSCRAYSNYETIQLGIDVCQRIRSSRRQCTHWVELPVLMTNSATTNLHQCRHAHRLRGALQHIKGVKDAMEGIKILEKKMI